MKPREPEPGWGVSRPSLDDEGVRRPSLEVWVGMSRVGTWRDGVGASRGDAAVVEDVDEDLVMGRRIEGMKNSEVLPIAVATARVDVMAKPLRARVLCDWDAMAVDLVTDCE